MRYDTEQITAYVEQRRKEFKIITLTLGLVLVTAMILIGIFYGNDNDIVFWSAISVVAVMLIFYLSVGKYSPAVLFSPEIQGTSIKEHEYTVRTAKQVYSEGRATIFAYGRRRVRKASYSIASSVYLKLDDGNIKEISGLDKKHTDLYEIGDRLLKFAGTKYPIILDRQTKRQPCPICGTINEETDKNCKKCGINIFKKG